MNRNRARQFLVQATDDLNASSSQTFTVQITNVVEDLDGDGTEDHYDDDIDGDGVSNANEILYSSDPLDAGSTNSPPFSFSSSSLTVAENSSIGTVVGEFNGSSSNSDDNFTFRILPDAPDGFSPLLWLDAADPFTLYSEVNRTKLCIVWCGCWLGGQERERPALRAKHIIRPPEHRHPNI